MKISDPTQQQSFLKKRVILILILALLIPCGILMKFYSGPASGFINNKLTGTLYVIFWSLFAALIFIRKHPVVPISAVLLFTCALEFLQLKSTPFLEAIRSGFIGRTLIGSSFAWTDFPWYVAGGLLSYLIISLINSHTISGKPSRS